MAQAKKKKKGRTVDAWKTKRWYKIHAPKSFEGKELGEVVSSDPKLLMGRIMTTTLREVTGNIPHQNIRLKFKVIDVKGESVETMPTAFEYNRGYIGRQTRRMHTLITTITDVVTKDGYKLRVKTISFGHGKTRLAQKKEIRRLTEENIKALCAKKSYEKLLPDLIHGKTSGEIFKLVKKIYPLSKTEVIKCRIMAMPEKK